jgi:hypothetical protein
MKYFIIRIVLFLIISVIAGCGTSPLSRHSSEEVIKIKLNNKSTVLLADAIVVDGLVSDTSVVNIIENKRIAKLALQMFAGRMNELGYSVQHLLNTSVGLIINPLIPYRIIDSPELQEIDPELIGIGTAPFYVNELFTEDTLRGKLLKTVYASLIGYEQNKGEEKKIIPVAPYLSKSLGGGLLGIIFIGGFNAGATNEFGKYIPPISQTENKVGVRKISQYSMMFFLIDETTGAIIWDDEVVIKGGLMHNNKLQNMVNTICDRLL